jgi:hypothetical protein
MRRSTRSSLILLGPLAVAILLAGCGSAADTTPETSSPPAMSAQAAQGLLGAAGVPCPDPEDTADFDGRPLLICGMAGGAPTEASYVVYLNHDISTSCGQTDPANPLLDEPIAKGDGWLAAAGPLIDSGLTSSTVDMAAIAAALGGDATTLRAACGL